MLNIAKDADGTQAVITLIRDGLRRTCGRRLVRSVLYGSRARGDARPDSDFDVVVFLRDYRGLWAESRPLGRLAVEIFDRTGAVVNFLPAHADDYHRRTGFMHQVRSEGLAV